MDIAKVVLHVFVRHQGEVFAVCRVQGDTVFEDEDWFNVPQIWARSIQPLAVSMVDAKQDPSQVITRAVDEAVGGAFNEQSGAWETRDPTIIGSIAHWSLEISPCLIQFIMLGPETGGLRLIPKSDFESIVDLHTFDSLEEIPERCNAMLLDERDAMMQLCPK